VTIQEAIEVLEQLCRADGKCVFSQRHAIGIAVATLRAMEPTEDERCHCERVADAIPGVTSWATRSAVRGALLEQRSLARAPLEADNARLREAIDSALPLLDQLPAGGSGQLSAEILRTALEK
jgi:hypothetical protein